MQDLSKVCVMTSRRMTPRGSPLLSVIRIVQVPTADGEPEDEHPSNMNTGKQSALRTRRFISPFGLTDRKKPEGAASREGAIYRDCITPVSCARWHVTVMIGAPPSFVRSAKSAAEFRRSSSHAWSESHRPTLVPVEPSQ